jgi:dTDP-4-dehydrorhamnose reductase
MAAVQDARPSLIVNAAAYTAVDDAERDKEAALMLNGTVPGLIAREAAKIGAAVVHYSTDYIFDGTKKGAYVEDDVPAPLNEYGRSKLAGERAVAESGAAYLTFRTSWIYAATGKNFLLTILRLAETQPELRIVADQVGCPTSADVVADCTARALNVVLARKQGVTAAEALRPFAGTYHLACSGSTSWHGFAKEILSEANNVGLLNGPPKPVHAIATSDFPRPAVRPQNSVLATEKFVRTFGATIPSWQEALESILRQVAGTTRSMGHRS